MSGVNLHKPIGELRVGDYVLVEETPGVAYRVKKDPRRHEIQGGPHKGNEEWVVVLEGFDAHHGDEAHFGLDRKLMVLPFDGVAVGPEVRIPILTTPPSQLSPTEAHPASLDPVEQARIEAADVIIGIQALLLKLQAKETDPKLREAYAEVGKEVAERYEKWAPDHWAKELEAWEARRDGVEKLAEVEGPPPGANMPVVKCLELQTLVRTYLAVEKRLTEAPPEEVPATVEEWLRLHMAAEDLADELRGSVV